MIVVADTSPLRYLVLIDCIDILPRMFGRIVVPSAVVFEMSRSRSPERVCAWATSPPDWLEIMSAVEVSVIPGLGAGEREALSLAREIQAEALLIDDRDAVKEARRQGFTVLGTLVLLDEAATRSFIPDLPRVLERLVKDTNFRMNKTTEAIIEKMLHRNASGD